MTYVVINDDEQATLEILDEKPTLGHIEVMKLRGRGRDKIRMSPERGIVGWVSDVGLINDAFRRNILGACLIPVLSGRAVPVGGPLVITGYEYPAPGQEEWGFPEPMTQEQVSDVVALYVAVRDALGMGVPAHLVHYQQRMIPNEKWKDDIRDVADWARNVENPGLTINHGPQLYTPSQAAAAVIAMMYGPQQPDPATDLVVSTVNPDLLALTCNGLPGVRVSLVEGSFTGERCTLRASGNVGFLKFAIDSQGYGKVLAERPAPEGS